MKSHKGGHYFPQKTKRWDANPTTVQFGDLYVEHSSWKVDYFFSHFKFGSLCEEECSRKDHQIKWSPGSRRESTQPREMATVFVRFHRLFIEIERPQVDVQPSYFSLYIARILLWKSGFASILLRFRCEMDVHGALDVLLRDPKPNHRTMINFYHSFSPAFGFSEH